MAYTLQFTTNNVSLVSSWEKNGTVVTRHANTATASRSIVVSGIPAGAIIESAVLTVKMRGSSAYGTNKELCTVNGVNCNSSGGSTPITNTIPITVTGNQTVNLAFAYKGNELVGSRPGVNEYSFTATFEEITVSVAYSMPAPAQPPSVASGWYALTVSNDGTAVHTCPYYVVGYSKIKADFDPSKVTVYGGATIRSFSVTYNGVTTTQNYSSGHVNITTGVIQSAISSIVLTVTDSNGRTATATATISAYSYARPALTNLSAFRSNSSKAADDNGTYIAAKATYNYSTLGGFNTISMTAQYKLQSSSAYGEPVTLPNNTLTLINSASAPISTQSAYTVRIVATDRLGNSTSYEQTIRGAEIPFNIKRGGKGAAFGRMAEADGCLDIGWILRCFGGISFGTNAPESNVLYMSSDLTKLTNVPSGVSYGSYISFGKSTSWDSRYILITENTSYHLYIGLKITNAQTITWYAVSATQV